MSNPDGSRLHPYANPPAAPPPGSPAPEQGGPRSREEGETDASDFVPSQSTSQAATADDLVPRQLSSLAATVAVNLLLGAVWILGYGHTGHGTGTEK